MSQTQKPRVSLAEIKRLVSEEGWENKEVAEYFGIKAIDVANIKKTHNILKKKVFKPRFELVMDIEEEVTDTAVETAPEGGTEVESQTETIIAESAEEVSTEAHNEEEAAPQGWG